MFEVRRPLAHRLPFPVSVPLMKTPFEGGCACGAVRYRCDAEPIGMLKCHCRDCQRISGSPHVCAILIPRAAFHFTKGQPKYFCTSSADGGQHQRGFCANCGSRLTGGEPPDHSNDFIGITAGSLDDASWFKPGMELWLSDAQPWDPPLQGIAHFEKNPPA